MLYIYLDPYLLCNWGSKITHRHKAKHSGNGSQYPLINKQQRFTIVHHQFGNKGSREYITNLATKWKIKERTSQTGWRSSDLC